MLNKLAIGVVIGSLASGISAQTVTDIPAAKLNSAYAQDARGTIVRNPYGLCWRTGYWTSADAVAGCDGELAPPIPKATAPEFAAPTTVATAPVSVTPPATTACDFSAILENDQTFPFAKAQLSGAAKNRIDQDLRNKLAGCGTIRSVIVTGHTDRLGATGTNQQLSEQRAAAVAAYLKSAGVAAPVTIVGAGETEPVKSCDTKISRKKLIDCLAPNRRVVIDVKGSSK
ncbi:OmpA family protein [Undibacterium arcticum]|uniref:OmpA family protein n=1 Tax=Undibacterium arcticum TaxID=1762892 RepID=A0ABV7EWN7_9BURK